MNPLIEQLKMQFKSGSMAIRLVMINVGVFSFLLIIAALERLGVLIFDQTWLALPVDSAGVFLKPWTLLSSIFVHFSLWHLLGNMLFLYFAGSTYEQFFGAKRLLHLYLLGGLAGNLIELLAHAIFPALQDDSFSVVGASGAIMAIFMALAFSKPQLQVQLFGVFPLRIYLLALFFFLKDLAGIGTADQIAHFSHIGGAIFGFWSIQQFWHIRLARPWLGIQPRQTKPKMTVHKGGRPLTDEQFQANKQERQARLDSILDKISKKGYDALSKAEKDFLFQQSKDV